MTCRVVIPRITGAACAVSGGKVIAVAGTYSDKTQNFSGGLLSSPVASLVDGCRDASGDEGGHPIYQIAERNQHVGGFGKIDGKAANVAGRIKQFGLQIIGRFRRRGVHVVIPFNLVDAARMGGNAAPVDGNDNRILPR